MRSPLTERSVDRVKFWNAMASILQADRRQPDSQPPASRQPVARSPFGDLDDGAPGADAASRILTAARDLFAERGYEGASIRDIAQRAGVSKANIFHHFLSKANLYEAVLEDAHRHFQEQQRILLDHGRPLAEVLHEFAAVHLRQMLENPGMVNLCLSDGAAGDNGSKADTPPRFADGFRGLVDALTDRLEDGRAAPRRDAELLALAVLGSSYAYFRLDALREGVDGGETIAGLTGGLSEPERYAHALIELLLPGLGLDGVNMTG
jgi:TetR/AcrR family transcriptional regulator